MNIHELIVATDTHLRGGEQRMGQALFNALHDLSPELADLIRGTDVDPFYNDDRILAFFTFIEENNQREE